MSVVPVRRLLLVGFMGSGKTTVGRLLAERLGWRFVDFDDVVEKRLGLTIPEVFDRRGEAVFRVAEDEVARALLSEDGVVLGSGGGWAAFEGRLAALPPGTAAVWLRVSPEEALRRCRAATGRGRPLLAVERPLERARELLEARGRYYAAAPWTVDTEGRSPVDVCEQIETLMAHPATIPAPTERI